MGIKRRHVVARERYVHLLRLICLQRKRRRRFLELKDSVNGDGFPPLHGNKIIDMDANVLDIWPPVHQLEREPTVGILYDIIWLQIKHWLYLCRNGRRLFWGGLFWWHQKPHHNTKYRTQNRYDKQCHRLSRLSRGS